MVRSVAGGGPGGVYDRAMGRIGFIGIGIMGSGMAANLVGAGHEVTVWNRTRSRAEAIEGVAVAPSPAEVARQCPIVMICVSDTPDVIEVVEGEDGLAGAWVRGRWWSTTPPSVPPPRGSWRLGGETARPGWMRPFRGARRGRRRAPSRSWWAALPTDLERARPYMEAFGSTITHVGPVGAGQTAKLVNQILVVVNQLAASEALLLAEAADLDLEATLAAVEGGAAGSWMLSNRGPQMIRRDWSPGFTIDLQQKDLRLVLEAADELATPLPGTALVFQLYRALQRRGLGSEGNHALVKALEELSGLQVGGG
jgi:3-hydroxyisobutyrate dehydrogenase-like beta-hydroxyacid dehydrogenase